MPAKKKLNSSALQHTYERYIQGKPEREASFEEELVNAEVAHKLYALRTKAGLSQRALAKRTGTTASVICRLEDTDYEGHSLGMLKRISAALDKRMEIRFVPPGRLPCRRTVVVSFCRAPDKETDSFSHSRKRRWLRGVITGRTWNRPLSILPRR